MKKLGLISILVLSLGAFLMVACGKKEDTPVDQFIEVMDQATKKAEEIKSMADVYNVQEILSPQEGWEIIRNNADYPLTDSDKKKLKKSFDKLLRVGYEKTVEYSGLPEELKKQSLAQVDLIIEGANKMIDNAQTFGEISGIK